MAQRVVLIFVDGLGVGERDPAKNPMARVMGTHLSVFSNGEDLPLPRDGISRPLDATLDLEGLPQSATGQTALLTGINAAKVLDRHLCGFPNRALKEIIMEHSLLKRVRESGLRAAFLNVFRPRFFEMGDAVWEAVPLSVTTWVNHAADLPFFSLEDLVAERAIYQEFTNKALRLKGFDVPLFTPAKAGHIAAERSRDFHLTLFEYFRTDAIGHSQNMERAEREIHRLEAFLEAFLDRVDLEETLVILTSDHGNIEDLSVRTHTRNPALTLLFGREAAQTAECLEEISQVPRVILNVLNRAEDPGAEDQGHP